MSPRSRFITCLVAVIALGPGVLVWSQMNGASNRKALADGNDAELADVLRQVRSAVPNPEDVEFRDVRYFRETGAGCGSVGAKDAAGTITGFSRFVVLQDGGVWYEPAQNPQQIKAFDVLANIACRHATDVAAVAD